MKKMLSRVKQSNKGFTLIELIIVIAIIAVLAAVIAPQYIKYVERSREATDANAASEIAHAAEVAYVGDGTTQPTNNVITFAIDSAGDGGAYADSTTSTTSLAGAVEKVTAHDSYTFKSKYYRGKTLTFTVGTNGKCTWSSGTNGPSSTAPTSNS